MLSEASQKNTNTIYDFTYLWDLKNEIKEPTKQKQTHRHREQTDGHQMGGRLGGWVKKVKGYGRAGGKLQDSHGDVQDSTGNRLNNNVITICGSRWLLELLEGLLHKLYNCLTSMWHT